MELVKVSMFVLAIPHAMSKPNGYVQFGASATFGSVDVVFALLRYHSTVGTSFVGV